MTDKIINTFQQRRQLEQAVADLAQAGRAVAHTFPHEMIPTLLVKHPDTTTSQIIRICPKCYVNTQAELILLFNQRPTY